MRRKRMIAKRRKNIERLSSMNEAINRKRLEQKANLISDRTFLNLINERVIANDLFDHNKISGSKANDAQSSQTKAPANSLESEVVINKKSSKHENEKNELEKKIIDLKFHETETSQNLTQLVDSEGSKY